MICAKSSPRMSCSVKFFDPTTIRFAFRSQPASGKRSKKMSNRKIDLGCRVKLPNLNHQGHEVSRRKSRRPETFVNLRALGGSCFFLSYDFKLRLHTQRPQSSLQSSEYKVGKERQQRRRNRSRQNHLVVHHSETAKNKLSESA